MTLKNEFQPDRRLRLGVVSFLNSRPLVDGLSSDPRVDCRYDVPARLPEHLSRGTVDVALVPVIDALWAGARRITISDACIGCDGETMTVRVFSQQPPHRIRDLLVDGDSHTSVALARVLWHDIYGVDLNIQAVNAAETDLAGLPAVLLIGDKVLDPARAGFAYEVDLGGAWRQETGLPFVFAVWCAKSRAAERVPDDVALNDLPGAAADLLSGARDRGVARAAQIAAEEGPQRGWPVELARRYLTRCLRYRLDDRMIAGAEHFSARCRALEIVAPHASINWGAACRDLRGA